MLKNSDFSIGVVYICQNSVFSCWFNQQGLDFLSFSVRGFDERTGIKRISQIVMIMLLASEPKPTAFSESLSTDFSGV